MTASPVLIFKTLSFTKKVLIVINDELGLENASLLKTLSFKHNFSLKVLNNKESFDNFNFYLNKNLNKIVDIKKESKIGLIFSTNIKIESALLNIKLRLKNINEDFSLYSQNQNYQSNVPISFINLNFKKTISFLEGKHSFLSKIFISFKNPIVCLGSGLNLRGLNNFQFKNHLKNLNASSIFLDIKLACNSKGLNFLKIDSLSKEDLIASECVFAINLDNNEKIAKILLNCKKEIFWFNSHGSKFALKTNILVPIASEFEEEKLLLNLESRPQKTLKTLLNVGNSRNLNSLLLFLNGNTKSNFYSFLSEISSKPLLFDKFNNYFLNSVQFIDFKFKNINYLNLYPIKSSLEDFYLSNKTSKNSLTMIKCSQENRVSVNNFFS